MLTHRELLQSVWGPDDGDQVDCLRVVVNQSKLPLSTVGLSQKLMGQIVELTTPNAKRPAARDPDRASPAIRTTEVHVVFTSIDETFAAVRIADVLAKAMGVPLTLIHFLTIPYPLQVDGPNGRSLVEMDALVDRLRSEGVNARVRAYRCHDALRTIPLAFRRHSLIVLGGRRRWWPTQAERWRRALEARGHFVVFLEVSEV